MNFSKLVAIATGTSAELIPLYCALFYASALFVHVYGGTVFWRANTLIALASMLIILVFILGSAPYADFHQNASLSVAADYDRRGEDSSSSPSPIGGRVDDPDTGWVIGGVPMFLRAFPVSAWFFVGVESLNFACVFVEKVSGSISQTRARWRECNCSQCTAPTHKHTHVHTPHAAFVI